MRFLIIFLLAVSTANALVIGGLPSGYLNGSMDEIRIYSRALTLEELLLNFNSTDSTPSNEEIVTLTNSSGYYNVTFQMPDEEADYIIKVNTTYEGIYGENTQTVHVENNTCPIIDNISIMPLNPTEANSLNCTVNITDDDPLVNLTFIWFINGTPKTDWNTTLECNTSKPCYTDTLVISLTRFNNYTCSAKAVDALVSSPWVNSSNVTIQNYIPNISFVNIIPQNPNLTSQLNCSVNLTDVDDELINLTFKWYVNNITDNSWNTTIECNTSNLCYTDTLVQPLVYNNEYICSAKGIDSYNESIWVNSTYVTVGNVPPTIVLISPENDNTTTNRMPLLIWDGNDINGDTLTYNINITCLPDCGQDNRYIEGYALETYTLPNLKYFGDDGYYYTWTVQANDSVNVSDWPEARNLTLQALIMITLDPDTVDFGSMFPDNSSSTEDDSPPPFGIRNDGNCVVNITLEAGNYIWQTVDSPSDYYNFLAGINETGSYSSAMTTRTQMTKLTNYTIITELNYSDSRDSARLDINLTSPHAEPPGAKEGNITIGGEYVPIY